MSNKLKKPQITKSQLKRIQWLNTPNKKDAIRVGRFQEYWVLSQNEIDSPILVYNQAEWDAFVSGVKDHEFDKLV